MPDARQASDDGVGNAERQGIREVGTVPEARFCGTAAEVLERQHGEHHGCALRVDRPVLQSGEGTGYGDDESDRHDRSVASPATRGAATLARISTRPGHATLSDPFVLNGGRFLTHFPYIGGQPVTAPRRRLDVDRPGGLIAQNPAQREHLLREVRLLDCGVAPQVPHQLALGDDAVAVPQKEQQQIQRLGSDGDGLTSAHEPLIQHVDTVRPELVVVPAKPRRGGLIER